MFQGVSRCFTEMGVKLGVFSKKLGLAEARKQRNQLKEMIQQGIDPGTEKQQKKLQRTSGVFRFGIASGYCEADLAEPLKGLISPPKVTNMAAISPDELPTFLHAVNRYNANTITKLAVELMLHTFLRTSEMIGKSITENGETVYLGAEWSEIDFDIALWNIPAPRMKVKRAHVVPLSKQSIAILKELQAITGHRKFLFPNHRNPRKPMSNATILRLIERIGYKGRMTGHGFRSIASTILNESGLWRIDAIESQLAHVQGNEVRAAYNRAKYLPERKEMMQWYSDYIDRISGVPVLNSSLIANK